MVDVPADCGGKPLFDAVSRLPTEFGGDAGGVDGISPIVTRPISHWRDQFCVWSVVGLDLVELLTNLTHHLFVRGFAMTANAVAPTWIAATSCKQ